MIEGTLIVNNKNLRVKFFNKNGKEVSMNVKESELSAPLFEKKKSAINELNGLEVELEEDKGQPKQIREKTKREFHNPYNFIPAPPRNTKHSELGDHLPKGHGCYHQDYWSGRILVTLKTITPLLIPDAANATNANATKDEQNKTHKIYPIRIDAEGKPYLPPTSIKGMLRSAYEAVTNSRFGIFGKHEDPLAYRTPPKVDVVPARVEKREEQLCLRIMKRAVRLKFYSQRNNPQTLLNRCEETRKLLKHGDYVWVKINARGQVINIRKVNNSSSPNGDWKQGWVCITGQNINNKTHERVFLKGHDDFVDLEDTIKFLWKDLIADYRNQKIYNNNIEARKNNGQSPQEYLGDDPGDAAWSRHFWDDSQLDLKVGLLCYVKINNNHKIRAIQPVSIARRFYDYPPRKLLHCSLKPADCIDELSPADRVFGWVRQNGNKRANQKGATSYKGNLRIFKVTCLTDNPFTDDECEFNDKGFPIPFSERGFPLAILGKPNEQQARFYQARDKNGNPLIGDPQDDFDKGKGYSSEAQGLRGRKVYPHHNGLPDNYWSNPNEYRAEDIDVYYQEYRQPPGDKEKTDQNRSIQAWVKPNVEFSFTIDIINLSSVELGALLWLLSLEDNYYHRLGSGKPLGFGSIQLSINEKETDLRTGQDWQEYYQSLLPIKAPDAEKVMNCIKLFKDAVEQAYGNGTGTTFEDVSFIKAFRTATKGFDDNLPIHYPRTTPEPNPEGAGFNWFVANESINNTEGGLKLSLPFLENDRGLPFNPSQN